MASKSDTRFTTRTTAMDAANFAIGDRGRDFSDKVAIITGANSGIGKEAAVALASAGCTVVLVCRSLAKAEGAATEVAKRAGLKEGEMDKVRTAEMELSSLASVARFADAYLNGEIVASRQLNILINNAGIMQIPKYTESEDGFELQFAVNFLAGFLLAKRLTPLLQQSSSVDDPSRVVNVASTAHYWYKLSRVDMAGLPVDKSRYNSFQEYGHSKMLQILHAHMLNKTLANGDRPVLAFSLHPGVIQTGLMRNAATFSLTWWLYRFPKVSLLLGLHKTLQAGAAPTVRLALDPALSDTEDIAVYFNDNCQPKKPKLPLDRDASGEALMKRAEELVATALAK